MCVCVCVCVCACVHACVHTCVCVCVCVCVCLYVVLCLCGVHVRIFWLMYYIRTSVDTHTFFTPVALMEGWDVS